MLDGIVDPQSSGADPWQIGGRRLFYIPKLGDMRFAPTEVGEDGSGLDGGKSLNDSIHATKNELTQELRTACPSK